MSFVIAESLDQALAAMADGARPIAGGSDLVVGTRGGKAPLPESLVAIDRVAELQLFEENPETGHLEIGSAINHARLMSDPIVVERYTALADAAALIGSPATRHVGTLGGNIMNGSPAMDTGAPLVVLGATVLLKGLASAQRWVSIDDLWDGPGSTIAAADELCIAIDIPTPPPNSGSAYVRLEYRRAMEIAVVGAAAAVTLSDDGGVDSARVALSAVAPTIIEVDDIATIVAGKAASDVLDRVAEAASQAASPISDLRASDQYRRHMVGVMARRAFDAAARRASGQTITVPVNRTEGVGAA